MRPKVSQYKDCCGSVLTEFPSVAAVLDDQSSSVGSDEFEPIEVILTVHL